MQDEWIKGHVSYCCVKHLEGDSDVLRAMSAISVEELDITSFISKIGPIIRLSKDSNVLETKRCVEEAIVHGIIEDDGAETRVAAFYEQLASTAIAKHLWSVYKGLKP